MMSLKVGTLIINMDLDVVFHVKKANRTIIHTTDAISMYDDVIKMEIVAALHALCEGNPLVTGGFPSPDAEFCCSLRLAL